MTERNQLNVNEIKYITQIKRVPVENFCIVAADLFQHLAKYIKAKEKVRFVIEYDPEKMNIKIVTG